MIQTNSLRCVASIDLIIAQTGYQPNRNKATRKPGSARIPVIGHVQ
jgi:hypothetical protein